MKKKENDATAITERPLTHPVRFQANNVLSSTANKVFVVCSSQRTSFHVCSLFLED